MQVHVLNQGRDLANAPCNAEHLKATILRLQNAVPKLDLPGRITVYIQSDWEPKLVYLVPVKRRNQNERPSDISA